MDESIYYAEIKLLNKYCSTFPNETLKKRIIMYLFKKMLYDNATELELTDDASIYYTEMLNILNMVTTDNAV